MRIPNTRNKKFDEILYARTKQIFDIEREMRSAESMLIDFSGYIVEYRDYISKLLLLNITHPGGGFCETLVIAWRLHDFYLKEELNIPVNYFYNIKKDFARIENKLDALFINLKIKGYN
jgi:hypothetical protein